MHTPIIPLNQKLSFRDKARLNACIARDLADYFGGSTADYLRPLNHKLREEIHHQYRGVDREAAVAA